MSRRRAKLADAPPASKPKKSIVSPKSASRELWFRPNLTGWTPERAQRAQEGADDGMLIEAADLVEAMMADDRISGVLSTRTHALLGCPVEFKGGSKEARRMLAGNAEEKTGEWWHMHDESELQELLSWGLLLGIGIAQRIELPRVAGRPHRYRIETWSPRWLTYYHYGSGGSHWKILTQDGQKNIFPGDGEWIIFQPYGARRPWSKGLWKKLVLPWLLKHYSLEDRANFSEVLGSPIKVGKTGPGSTDKQRKDFKNQLLQLGKNGVFTLPDGWDLKLVESASSGKTGDVFDQQIKWADEANTVALAGQLVTTEGTPGFSNGDPQNEIKQDLTVFDAARLSTCLHQQSVEHWALANFGSHTVAPRPKYVTEKPEDINEASDGLQKLGDAILKLDTALKPHGLKVDAEKIASQFGIPLLSQEPDAPAVPAPEQKAPTAPTQEQAP